MGVFDRSSKSAACLAVLGALFGCQDRLPPVEGTSLRVEMVTPEKLGSPEARLAPEERTVTFSVRAYGADGEPVTDLNTDIDIYVHYQGSRTAPVNLETEPSRPPRWRMLEQPLKTVDLVNGVADGITLELPPVFGPTLIWVEDHRAEGDNDRTHALGTSETLWFPDPTLRDLSRPITEDMGIEKFFSSALTDKQVIVTGSRHGEKGRLVVTATYQDGYNVSDVLCQDEAGTPPCTGDIYDHALIFSFSRGTYEEGGTVEVGQTLSSVGGGVDEFNGLLELSFPRAHVRDATPNLDRLPEPVVIQKGWPAKDPIKMEQVEGALIAAEGEVCEVKDGDRDRGQFSVNVGAGCSFGRAIVVEYRTVAADFDPVPHEEKTIRVVGTLRPVQTFSNARGSFFQLWPMLPRSPDDIVLTE